MNNFERDETVSDIIQKVMDIVFARTDFLCKYRFFRWLRDWAFYSFVIAVLLSALTIELISENKKKLAFSIIFVLGWVYFPELHWTLVNALVFTISVLIGGYLWSRIKR